MFCVEEHKWGYFTRIYIGALGRRPHLGGRLPASALPSWGSMPQLDNKMYCICLSRHRALTSKCRRGDASPPGEDALPAGEDASTTGEDALLTRAYVRVHNIYLETFFCFMFHFHNTMH